MVYVLNRDGSPLMPCTEAKARHLIESGKAKVVRRTPLIIRITFLVEGEVNTESVTLGVDAGSSVIGVSATTEGRVLFEAEVEIRQDVPQNMEEQAEWQAEPQDPLQGTAERQQETPQGLAHSHDGDEGQDP